MSVKLPQVVPQLKGNNSYAEVPQAIFKSLLEADSEIFCYTKNYHYFLSTTMSFKMHFIDGFLRPPQHQ